MPVIIGWASFFLFSSSDSMFCLLVFFNGHTYFCVFWYFNFTLRPHNYYLSARKLSQTLYYQDISRRCWRNNNSFHNTSLKVHKDELSRIVPQQKHTVLSSLFHDKTSVRSIIFAVKCLNCPSYLLVMGCILHKGNIVKNYYKPVNYLKSVEQTGFDLLIFKVLKPFYLKSGVVKRSRMVGIFYSNWLAYKRIV